MESLDAVHMLAKTSMSDLTVRWSARHHTETHTVMSSLFPRPSEMDHQHSRWSCDGLRNWRVEGEFYRLCQKLMRTLSATLYSIFQQNESLQAIYQDLFARVWKYVTQKSLLLDSSIIHCSRPIQESSPLQPVWALDSSLYCAKRCCLPPVLVRNTETRVRYTTSVWQSRFK